MKVAKDIEGNELSIGDEVYYARANGTTGQLIKGFISKIWERKKRGHSLRLVVSINGTFLSTNPRNQIVKI